MTYSFSSSEIDYIAANNDGSNGNPITYISGHVHSSNWGVGRAVIDGTNADLDYATKRNGVLSLKGYNWITVDGLEIKNNPTVGGSLANIGWVGNSGGNVIITNCLIYDGGGDGIIIQGKWNEGPYPSNFIISKNTVYNNNGHNIMLRAGLANVIIINNTLYNPGVEVYTGAHAGDNIDLAYGNTALGTDNQTDITITGNDMSNCPIKGHILLQQETSNVIVEDNYMHGEVGVAAILTTGPQTNLIIRNNLITSKSTTYEGTLRFRTDQGGTIAHDGIKIFNNTIVGDPYLWGGVIYFHKGNSEVSDMFKNVDIRNNIIDSTRDDRPMVYIDENNAATGPVVELATFTCDYNAYDWGSMANPFFWRTSGVNFASWKTVTGGDSNSIKGDALFVDISNPKGPDGIMWTEDDGFRPQAGSPVCGAGEGGTDIGAYECIATTQTCTEAGGTCQINACGTYTDCASLTGTCATGSCCSGTCTSSGTCSAADTSGDDVVSITELMNYISQWKAGSVTITELMIGIGEWKNGCA